MLRTSGPALAGFSAILSTSGAQDNGNVSNGVLYPVAAGSADDNGKRCNSDNSDYLEDAHVKKR